MDNAWKEELEDKWYSDEWMPARDDYPDLETQVIPFISQLLSSQKQGYIRGMELILRDMQESMAKEYHKEAIKSLKEGE